MNLRSIVFFGIALVALISSCNPAKDNSAEKFNDKGNADSILTEQQLIEVFNRDEKSAMDSISYYGLTAAYDSCLKYLYLLYGNEQLDSKRQDNLTIGECNIRLIGFRKKNSEIRTLHYNVFINDSVPVRNPIFTSMGLGILGFNLDIKTKKIVSPSCGELCEMEMSTLYVLCDSARRSDILKEYIDSHKPTLHPKFIRTVTLE